MLANIRALWDETDVDQAHAQVLTDPPTVP
jgi:hypothetical protein